jgi:hypothetical protein
VRQEIRGGGCILRPEQADGERQEEDHEEVDGGVAEDGGEERAGADREPGEVEADEGGKDGVRRAGAEVSDAEEQRRGQEGSPQRQVTASLQISMQLVWNSPKRIRSRRRRSCRSGCFSRRHTWGG